MAGDELPTQPGKRPNSRPNPTRPADGVDVTMPGSRMMRGSDRKTASSNRVGRLSMREELGHGGMGRVWLADDPDLRRKVAVKLLRNPDNLTAVQRFLDEAQITGQLEHPNIVPVHQLGRDAQGRPWLEMKLVRGTTLRDVIGRPTRRPVPLTPEAITDLLDIFAKVCDAVAFAHNRGVIHRDLKPDNVMVGEFGEVLVMDWGLARTVDTSDVQVESQAPGTFSDLLAQTAGLTAEEPGPSRPPSRPPSSTSAASRPVVTDRNVQATGGLTMEGEVFGTPAYMAPEQATGNPADTRTDIFALGAILYHMLTKQVPYEGKDTLQVVMAASKRDLLDPRHRAPGRQIPRELAAITMTAMAAEPDERYETVEELQADLHAWRTHRPVTAAPPGPAARVLKWARRHPAAAMAGGVGVVAAAVIAVIVTTVMAFASRQQAIATQQKLIAAEARERAEAEARIAAQKEAEAQRLADEKFLAELRAKLQEGEINQLREALGVKVERQRNAARDRWSEMAEDVVGLGTDIERLIEPLGPDEVEEILAGYKDLFEAWETHGVGDVTAKDYVDRGVLYSALLDFDAAMADVERAVQMDPEYWPAWIFRAICQINRGAPLPPGVLPEAGEPNIEFDAVVADVDRAIALKPELASERAAVWTARGVINTYAKRYPEAHSDFARAEAEDPRLPLLWSSRGVLYSHEGDQQKAMECHNEAVRHGDGTAAPHLARGIHLYSIGYPRPSKRDLLQAAIDDFDIVLILSPESSKALAYRGCARFYLGERLRCFADLNRAIELRPNDYFAWYCRCGVYIQLLNIPKAIEDFEEGYKRTPPSLLPALDGVRKLVDQFKKQRGD